jgi:RNA-binding protein YlmH
VNFFCTERPSGAAVVALLQVSGNFMFDAADHRDFLGAVLGTGIERDRVGDILVQGERGAQVLATPEMATFLSQARPVCMIALVPI